MRSTGAERFANPAPSQEQEPDEPIVVLERRLVDGRGVVEVGATCDETGVLLIEERAGKLARIIAIVTPEGQARWRDLLTDGACVRYGTGTAPVLYLIS